MTELSLQLSVSERDKLIEGHQIYVRKLASKINQTLPSFIDFEELVGYGMIGLIEAAERFDPRRGVSFTTFSHYRIKGAIFDGLRQMGYYNNSGNKQASWAANANDILQTASDDIDNQADIAVSSLEDEVTVVENILEGLIPSYLLSLDSEEAQEVADGSVSVSTDVESREMLRLIMESVEELSIEEQNLIRDIYFKHIPMVEIARLRGSNKSWISRLHARAIQRIQDKLRKKGVLEKKQELRN